MTTHSTDIDWDPGEDVKWTPRCPIGNPQRPRICLAYREREPGRLQLRVPLGTTEGVCEVVTDEQADTVYVRVVLCYQQSDEDERRGEYLDCPVHVYLEEPLGERTVFDVESRQYLPLFVPDW